jgi:hypothetical protein
MTRAKNRRHANFGQTVHPNRLLARDLRALL